ASKVSRFTHLLILFDHVLSLKNTKNIILKNRFYCQKGIKIMEITPSEDSENSPPLLNSPA
ncbi:hypothetical protein, partial [Pseudomonas fluorescens]|uniref:hypothetical protein n=1 Tax=Pseudomonas fluorescens TaxID=294 RepID=UPI001BE9F329